MALMWLEEKAAGISVVYKQAFDSLFPIARSQARLHGVNLQFMFFPTS